MEYKLTFVMKLYTGMNFISIFFELYLNPEEARPVFFDLSYNVRG